MQELIHRLIVALSQVATGMRCVADNVESGALQPQDVAPAMRIMADAMTQMVSEISQ